MKRKSLTVLRQEREKRGWSRNYIAEHVEVDVITVGRWERGERLPHPHHRQKLCALFEMNAQELGFVSVEPQEVHDVSLLTVPPNASRSGNAGTIAHDTTIHTVIPAEQEAAGTIIYDIMRHAANPSKREVVLTRDIPSRLFAHRRKFLIGALETVSIFALTGSYSHSSSRSLPAPISMPLSTRSHYFLDLNAPNWVNRVAWSPDGRSIALAHGSNVISIWSIEKSTLILYYPTFNGWVNDISWSKANVIATATADFHTGSVQLWKFPEEKPVFTLQRAYGLRSVAWSPDNTYLAISGRTPTVEVWDPFANRVVSQYTDTNLGLLGITRVRWSASGKFLACATDNHTVHVWEALTGKPRITYQQHKKRVIDLAWSPDERHIVSSSADKTSHVWDVSSGRPVHIYQGHTDEVEGVDWASHGQHVASGSADHTVQVWEPFTGRLIAIYAKHNCTVETVLWSRDARTLAIGTQKEGAGIWQAP